MNFIPVMPAGNDDANNHANENIFGFNFKYILKEMKKLILGCNFYSKWKNILFLSSK